jgi:hypothetical protein
MVRLAHKVFRAFRVQLEQLARLAQQERLARLEPQVLLVQQ